VTDSPRFRDQQTGFLSFLKGLNAALDETPLEDGERLPRAENVWKKLADRLDELSVGGF